MRGRQVFSEFSRAMNALNDEVNQGRLSLVPLASSAAFTTRQRITAGRPAFGADLDAPTDDQERGVVQTIGGVPVEEDPAVARTRELAEQAAERISDNTLSRSIQNLYRDVERVDTGRQFRCRLTVLHQYRVSAVVGARISGHDR